MDTVLYGLNSLFSNRRDTLSITSQSTDQNSDTVIKKSKVLSKSTSKYDGDIEALRNYFDDLQEGAELTIKLSKILEICPRKRKRVEAYQGLLSKLDKEMNIKLIIISNKKTMKEVFLFGEARNINDLTNLNKELKSVTGLEIKVSAKEINKKKVEVVIPLNYPNPIEKGTIPDGIALLILRADYMPSIPYFSGIDYNFPLIDIVSIYKTASQEAGLKVKDLKYEVNSRGIVLTITK